MKLIHTPRFFDPAKAGMKYEPDIAGALREGIAFGHENRLLSAADLIKAGKARLLALTDLQNDFRDGGRLPVKGTDQVVLRICERLMNGVVEDCFGGILFSLDGHGMLTISFDAYWRDREGKPLDLSNHGGAAVLVLEDRKACLFTAKGFGPNGLYVIGQYTAIFDKEDSVAYWDHLQSTGQGDIYAFNVHCVVGTDGYDLHPLLAETIAFACGARSIDPFIVRKGYARNTDWFGPLAPCRPVLSLPNGGYHAAAISYMTGFAATEFAGVAEDFCNIAMLRQAYPVFAELGLAGRMNVIVDGTAPIVPNAPHVLRFYEEARAAGVKFIAHDAPLQTA